MSAGLASLAVLGGCLGNKDSSEHYTLAASKNCYAGQGEDVVRDTNDPKASGGWLRINYDAGWVAIGFGKDESEAKRLKHKLIGDAPLPYPFTTEVATRGNAVYTSGAPTMEQDTKERIEACLR